MSDELIPDGWTQVKLGDVCVLHRQSVNPGKHPDEVFAHYSLPAFDEGQEPKLETGSVIKSNKYLVPSDAVLLSKLNPHIPRIWMPDVANNNRPIASTEYLVLSPKSGCSRGFLYGLFRSSDFFSVFGTMVSGTTGSHQRVTPSHVLEIKILLPPLHEQKAIAHILGTLDDKIDQLRKTNTVLEDMASALFKSWFVDFDPVKAKLENSLTGLPKDLDDLFPDSFEDSALGPIPTGWRVGCVGDVCDLTKSSVNPGNFPHEVFAHYSLPAYDEGQQPKLELGASIKSNKYLVPSDAVLLSKLNPHIPRIWMPDVSTQHRPIASTEFLALCPKPGYSRELVYTLVTSQMFCQIYGTLVSGTTGSHQRVSPASVLDVAIVLPPEPIANEFFDVTKHNALRVHSNIQQILTLANLQDTLLPKLISGDIRVPEAEQMVAELGL